MKKDEDIISFEYATMRGTRSCHESRYMNGLRDYTSKYEGEYAQLSIGNCYYANKPYSREYLDMLYMLGLCEVI